MPENAGKHFLHHTKGNPTMTTTTPRYEARETDGHGALIFDNLQGVYIYDDDGIIEFPRMERAQFWADKWNNG